MYAEEVERTTTEFMNHFDTLSQTVDKLKVELQNKTKQVSVSHAIPGYENLLIYD